MLYHIFFFKSKHLRKLMFYIIFFTHFNTSIHTYIITNHREFRIEQAHLNAILRKQQQEREVSVLCITLCSSVSASVCFVLFRICEQLWQKNY